jgi:hypothetical protein
VSADEWAEANPNPMLGTRTDLAGGHNRQADGGSRVGTDNTAGHTVAMVSLTTGDPGEPDGVVTASTWLIGDAATAEAFRAAMTERYGKPMVSEQPAGLAGTDEGLVIFGEGEAR